MPLVLDATPKGTASNSYITAADADTYFLGRMATAAWDAADTATKERALVAATNRLDQEEYVGTKTDSTQRLKWPRTGVYDDDGLLVDADTIPRVIAEATCEIALEFLNAGVDTDTLALGKLAAFNVVQVPGVRVEPARNTGTVAGTLSPQVQRLLGDWLDTPGGSFRWSRG